MTELEKIKREIDDDLKKLGLLPAEEVALVYNAPPVEGTFSADATLSASAAPPVIAPVFSTSDFSSAGEAPPPAGTFAVPENLTDGFYRETIKAVPFPERKPRMPWRKKLVAACLVCTLGTGTLGLGIGAAVASANYFWNGGIESAYEGETLADLVDYSVDSARYVFSGGEGARDASLSDMIELVEPAVVRVSAVFPMPQDGSPGFPQEFQPRFPQEELPRENVGSASGIIFKEDASLVYIATNDHVVRGANSVSVQFTGSDRPVPATQVGMNLAADLAVISVEKRDLRRAGVSGIVIAGFGDSDTMEMGDAVIAIGNALGAGNIATQGIISATEKIIPVEGRTLTVIQTDAAINMGNSGGALFNTSGEVIGINSAKLMAYSVEGMGFSISSNIALPILEDLMKTSSRPSLGIMGGNVTAELAEQEGLSDTPLMGVYVDSVIPGMGAESAGIESGDIITGFNGEPVFNMDQLKEAIRQSAIGEEVEVNILRDGQLIKLPVEMTETVVNGFTN